MTQTILKIIMLCVVCTATMMSGCLGIDATAKDDINADMGQLQTMLESSEYSDEEKHPKFIEVGEKYGMEDATSEKYELNSESNVIPTEDVPKYRVAYNLMDSGADLLAGVGYFTVVFNGILIADNTTVSGFENIGLDKLESVEIFINNESVAEFTPVLNEKNKIETTQVGDWVVRIEATLTDGTTITIRNAKFNGMKDMSDHPDYKSDKITITGSGPFDARYIETDDKAMPREEAKALCEELGIVWGDDRNIPTEKPTLTSTKVVSTQISPTPTPIPTTIRSCFRLDVYLDKMSWDLDTIALVRAYAWDGRGHNITPAIEYVTIRVNGTLVATIVPTVVQWNTKSTRRIIECPMLINLPDGIYNTGEITMEVSISNTPHLADGIYPMPISVRTPPVRYEEEYNQFPVWNP